MTAAGPGQTPVTTTTGGDGAFALDVAGSGPYGIAVRATGFAAESTAAVAADATLPPIALAPATFTPLPVDVGPTNAIAADATSGIFYALMNGAPELYRTLDYGGSWQPVTASYDDFEDGLRNPNSRNLLAVSSVSGEVAVGSDGLGVSYSTDYGLTWRRIGGVDPPLGWAPRRRDPLLFWGHARPGAPSVLVLADPADDGSSWRVWRADMSAANPTFVQDAGDPFGGGSQIAHADSRTGSFIGRVSASGELSFAPLTESGPLAFGPAQATGLPAPPGLLQLGGMKEDGAPPGAALVAGGAGPSAQMLTKAAGAAGFEGASSSAPTTVPDHCVDPGDLVRTPSSVAPTSVGATGAGSLARCWLNKDGTDPLSFPGGEAGGIFPGAYDARWGQDNFVAFMAGFTFGGANLGPLKYGRLNADGGPVVEIKPGTGGTGADSGGFSLSGLTSAPVGDTAYGPGGESEQAVALTTDSLASRDGGRTMTPILPRGSEWSDSVDWWRGASGDWLLFGHASRCGPGREVNMLTGLRDWDGSRTLPAPNVSGSACSELGVPVADLRSGPVHSISSLRGVPGSDTVFIGVGGDQARPETHHVLRGTLGGGDPPALTGLVNVSQATGVTLPNRPVSMAYCPAVGGDADVLFAALGTPYEHDVEVPGGLVRITGATSGSPTGTLVGSIPSGGPQSGIADVRADCESGTVYAGGYDGIQGVNPGAENQTAFFKSTDGGRTFTQITIPGPSGGEIGEITAIGLDPRDPNSVEVAAETVGTIAQSGDGGATWTMVNDPVVSRSNRVNDIEYPPPTAPPAPRALFGLNLPRAAQAGASPPQLVGTSGGAFHGDVVAEAGVLALQTGGSGSASLGVRITSLSSDDNPVAVPAAVRPNGATLFHRSDGLALSFAGQGTWSVPSAVPGTSGADDHAVVAAGRDGRLHVAFARRGAGAGIYLVTQGGDGVWSPPRRLSARAGDRLPAIAAVGTRIHVVFLRTRGRGRGVWHVAASETRARRARRIRRTRRADARVSRGGPALGVAGRRVQLAFARAGRRGGIYYTSARGSRWTRPKRVARGRRSAQPTLVVGARRVRHIVFRARRGLFALRGRGRWSRRRVRGTTRRDRDPALSRVGSGLGLVFARRSGRIPGIRYARTSASGAWRGRPVRISADAADRDPSLQADPRGRLTIVFERR